VHLVGFIIRIWHCRFSRAFLIVCCVVWCSSVHRYDLLLGWPNAQQYTERTLQWHCSLLSDVGGEEYTVVTAYWQLNDVTMHVCWLWEHCAEMNLLSGPCCHSTICSVHWASSPRCPMLVKLTVAKATGNKRSSKQSNKHHNLLFTIVYKESLHEKHFWNILLQMFNVSFVSNLTVPLQGVHSVSKYWGGE